MVSINLHFLLIILISLPQILATSNWRTYHNDYISLANATAFIIREHFRHVSTTVVIVEKSVHSQMQILNTDLVEHILQNVKETVAVQLYLGQSDYQPWDYHIFVVDGAEAFREVQQSFPKTNYERKFRFLIILTSYNRRYSFVLKRIFTMSYELRVINANVIFNHPSLGVCMYTYKLFTEYQCRSIQPVLSFKFNKDFDRLKDVFPTKLMNFYKCPVRVVARQNPPLLIFTGDLNNPRNQGNWNNLGGIDGHLIRIISRHLNFTIELLPFPIEWSYFNFNDSYGCFAELLNGNADVAIGGFSASDPKRSIFSPSALYHHSPIVFVVRGGAELGSIRRLARPFKHDLWTILAIFLVIVAFIVHVLRVLKPSTRRFIVGERNDSPLTNFFAIFLGYAISRLPHRNFARYALLLWLLMAMIIRSAYQSSLYDSIRMDKFVKIPLGYEELLRWDYKFLVSNELKDLNILPTNRSIVLSGGHDVRFRVLEAMIGKYAAVALRENFLHYMEKNARFGSELKMIKEPLYLQQSAMYFPKHSIYKAAFNRNLMQFKYMGITKQIERNNAKEMSVLSKHKQSIPPKPITYDRLSGMYEVYGAMLALAVIVFSLELLSVYIKRLRFVIEWIN